MFCDRCGTELQPGQRFCGSCGKPVGVAVVPPAPSGRVARHLHLLAVLWFAASAINLIGSIAVFIVANTLFGHSIRFENAWPMQGFPASALRNSSPATEDSNVWRKPCIGQAFSKRMEWPNRVFATMNTATAPIRLIAEAANQDR